VVNLNEWEKRMREIRTAIAEAELREALAKAETAELQRDAMRRLALGDLPRTPAAPGGVS
jgi:hypothetical protein